MLTAWDGYARVDYLPNLGRIQVTLLTVEPTVYRRLRPGLACAFAADDTGGPPTFVEVDIGFGLTEDVSRHHAEVVLHGDRITVRDIGSKHGTTVDATSVDGNPQEFDLPATIHLGPDGSSARIEVKKAP